MEKKQNNKTAREDAHLTVTLCLNQSISGVAKSLGRKQAAVS